MCKNRCAYYKAFLERKRKLSFVRMEYIVCPCRSGSRTVFDSTGLKAVGVIQVNLSFRTNSCNSYRGELITIPYL